MILIRTMIVTMLLVLAGRVIHPDYPAHEAWRYLISALLTWGGGLAIGLGYAMDMDAHRDDPP